ncbi:MAG: family 20 glycosylhydrolase [Bacteroidia bacterium]|nr:family 20 glycosylhydrolase [Bacteroidia bacterium]MCF8427935.1 family 20 glycosylhydrolase [Bacteroidia bacterium]
MKYLPKPIFLLVLLLYTFVAKGQYAIIPKPNKSLTHSGLFTFSANQTIEMGSRDSTLQAQFKQWLGSDAKEKIVTNKMVQTKLALQILGPKKWDAYLKKLLFTQPFNPGKEGYVIKIEQNSILLLAQTETAMFYAFQTLKQLFRLPQIPCGEIYDKPSFPVRAWQDDISRGPIPKLSQLKKEIEILSHYKLNYFTLYTENVFQYSSHPNLAPKDGITAQEILELEKYAKLFHVELIANQQSFGHMEKVLANPKYAHLGENGHILSPAKSETYKLLNDFFTEINTYYKGNYFMLNADETFGLGTGITKPLVDSLGLAKVYALHINKLNELLKSSKKTPLMWADIVLAYPEMISLLPKEIIQVPWAYGNNQDFSKMLDPISKSGFDFWVAPGVSNWQNVYPNLITAKGNIFKLVQTGFTKGAKGVLNTSWDDDGLALFGNNYSGFIWGADISWSAPQEKENEDQRWQDFLTAQDLQFWHCELSQLQLEYAKMHQGKLKDLLRNVHFLEPIFPLNSSLTLTNSQNELEENLVQLNTIYKKVDSLSSQVNRGNVSISYLNFSIRQTRFTLEKDLFRKHYQSFLNQTYSKEKLLSELKQLEVSLQNIKSDFIELYASENREFWLKENLQKLDKLLKELNDVPYHCFIIPDENIGSKGRKFTLSAPLSSGPIYYSLGGLNPSFNDLVYTKPFYIKQDIKLKCALFANNKLQEMSSDSFVYHKAIGKLKEVNLPYSTYHPNFSGGGKFALTDGKIGSAINIKNGRWQGYTGADLVLQLNFEKPITMKEFRMGFYQNVPAWVIFPKEVLLFGSDNGKEWHMIGSIPNQVPVTDNSAQKVDFVYNVDKTKFTYLKVIAKYGGDLPASHASAGQKSMLFCDEIIIR